MTARQRLVPPGDYRLYGQHIQVAYSDPSDWSSTAMGRAFCQKNIVLLREDLNDEVALETFIHEIIHIIADKHNLGVASEETTIDAIAVGLIAFFRDNPRQSARWF